METSRTPNAQTPPVCFTLRCSHIRASAASAFCSVLGMRTPVLLHTFHTIFCSLFTSKEAWRATSPKVTPTPCLVEAMSKQAAPSSLCFALFPWKPLAQYLLISAIPASCTAGCKRRSVPSTASASRHRSCFLAHCCTLALICLSFSMWYGWCVTVSFSPGGRGRYVDICRSSCKRLPQLGQYFSPRLSWASTTSPQLEHSCRP
mmetsp:Transcript_58028/g.135989  ORF Transcript_58028/g.135989 Transcript_58028/m.135989 type:complete len:204 (-) Transcript_58028:30-641(-)